MKLEHKKSLDELRAYLLNEPGLGIEDGCLADAWGYLDVYRTRKDMRVRDAMLRHYRERCRLFVRLVRALDALRDGGQVAGDPVRRFLAHPACMQLQSRELPGPRHDWAAVFKHGVDIEVQPGPTPEAACIAALRALGDGAGERG